ncbi:FCD domain-containing protein [Amycolatopsis sp. H20-H5]|uniref:FCD domain-containing protein n=1 Tax=Amycolatopsis sp. H20-H5 TaxID=3046309 RepID=UPI003FA38279
MERAFTRTHCHLHFFQLSYHQPFGVQAIAEHRHLIDAMVAGRPEATKNAMTGHLETARDRLLSRL